MAKSRQTTRKGKTTKASAKSTGKGSKPNSRGGKGKQPSPRAKEIEAWWSVTTDLVDGKGPFRGASAVVKAFMEDYIGMSLEETGVILEAYRQFLVVKEELEDFDSEELIPCFFIDQMWGLHHQMPSYEDDMILLCGHTVRRGSEIDLGGDVLLTRQQATIEAIQNRFGKEYSDYVWNEISVGVDGLENDNDLIASYSCDKRLPLSGLLGEWAEDQGLSLGDFSFYYNRKPISANDTPTMLGMRSDDDISVVHKDFLQLIVRDSRTGQLGGYLYKRTDMLCWLMKSHAMDTEVDKSSLVFTFNGERIFGHEHPRDFSLDNYGIIEVVSVEDYKCDRCICCNPGYSPFVVG